MIQPGCGSGSAFIFSLGSGYGSALRNADPDPGEKNPKKSMEIIEKKKRKIENGSRNEIVGAISYCEFFLR